MHHRKIGSLSVSEVGLGCNNFGGRITQSETNSVVDACLEHGINFFDTADIYGNSLSETFLAEALGNRRKDVVIATKFGYEHGDFKGGASPAYIRESCEGSLKRLKTDVIDLYQVHTPDPNVPIEDTLGELDRLVKAGKVREIGCSNFGVDLLRNAEKASQPGTAKFVSVQNHYSLLHTEPEADVIPECERTGLAFLPFFPLASGLLSGKYRKGGAVPESRRIKEGSDKLNDDVLTVVESLVSYAEGQGHSILELSVSWLLRHPCVASVIAGATTPEQVKANAAAGNWTLTEDDIKNVGAIVASAPKP